MRPIDEAAIRRYVLGAASHAESGEIEEAYFAHASELDHVKAVEDDLIDDYVSGQLAAHELDAFERRYLNEPHYRTRIAIARSLRSEAAQSSASAVLPGPDLSPRLSSIARWSPIAIGLAAAIVLIGVTAWLVSSSPPSGPGGTSVRTTAPPLPSEPAGGVTGQPPEQRGTAAPRIVALVLSPINVRAGTATATLAIPEGTDIIVLHLQGEANERDMGGRAVVRTVAGAETWRGIAAGESGSPPSARLDVPAAALGVNDYVIALIGMDRDGRETERYSYFFSVRAPF